MRFSLCLKLLLAGVILSAGFAAAQDVNSLRGVINFAAPINPDPLLQHSKEIYILNGCVYCHGVDLVVRNGEAADLMHSKLIGRDDNGNLIGPLLRAGIPQTPKLSPMPQFSDLSDSEIADIVRWVHYARQQGHYKEVMDAKQMTGDAATGKAYFDQQCASCHSMETDFSKVGKKYDASALKVQILRPKFVDAPKSWKLGQPTDPKLDAARHRHLALLENYSPSDVANLEAYILASK
jgi:mono/diheme cytochrome c family protein